MINRWQFIYAFLLLIPMALYLNLYFNDSVVQTIEQREALFLETCDTILDLESQGCQSFLESYGDFMRR